MVSAGTIPVQSQQSPPSGGSKAGTIVAIILAILLILGGMFYYDLNTKYNKLNDEYEGLLSEYNSLQLEYDDLEIDYNQLVADYNNLVTEYKSISSQFNTSRSSYFELESDYQTLDDDYNALENDYNSLDDNYGTLNDSYNSLSTNYDSLQVDYDTLATNFDALTIDFAIEEAMNMGHLLGDYYINLRSQISPFTSQEQADFAANLAAHGLGRFYWPSYEAFYYDSSDLIEGATSKTYSYNEARSELLDVYNLLGISSSDTPTDKVQKVLNFTHQYLHYEPDGYNAYLAPMETLTYHSGDCDDYSILVGALFEECGIPAAIAVGDTPISSHIWVLIQMDSLTEYPTWSYSDLTSYGLSPGEWILIEPQATIDMQNDDRIGDYLLDTAAEIPD